jgi:GNAT superfamily N-acetyltransferase
MKAASGISIERLPAGFCRWDSLLELINEAFAYMDRVIDPPSSAKLLTPQGLAEKAGQETCFIATTDGRLVGCIFAHERDDRVYVGKLAVATSYQKRAIGRALLQAAENHARSVGKPMLELQTRVELTGNHAAFERLGFRETERTAHAGYDRPTSLTLRKRL